MSTTEVVVGRVGRAHGVRGEVAVEPRTDEPDRRFAPGAVLAVRAGDDRLAPGTTRPASLTVRRARWHQARLLVSFAEVPDRESAEALRGHHLVASVDVEESPEDPEEFYDHQLVGLAVVTAGERRVVGEVSSVLHGTGQDLLVVSTPAGGEVLVPFVTALVPVVDVRAGRLEVADRPGLLTPLDEPDAG